MTTGNELADLLIVALVIATEAGFFGRFALRRVQNAGGGSKKRQKRIGIAGLNGILRATISTGEGRTLDQLPKSTIWAQCGRNCADTEMLRISRWSEERLRSDASSA